MRTISPHPRLVWTLLCAGALAWGALALGVSLAWVRSAVACGVGALLLVALADLLRTRFAWRAQPWSLERSLPSALALGVERVLLLTLRNPGRHRWQATVLDDVDDQASVQGMPQTVTLGAQQWVELRYHLTPRERGTLALGRVHVRLRSLWSFWHVAVVLGEAKNVHVYPNFAALARYAWLAGDKRLEQIGIKTYTPRGVGVDFKQLAEYQLGDSVRHVDWKATLRFQRPIVRQYQDERDQRVMFLLDCGRRMRADEGDTSAQGSHFDQALNALMLLTYVALKEGDEVGAMSFGNPDGFMRDFYPRKGSATLNALIASLYDIQPSLSHSDYVAAAQAFMGKHRKRALVILLTNFRDEDASELEPALKLLRSRHLVVVASLRERVLRDSAQQALETPQAVAEVATAHWFAQARSDAFRRVMGHDALSVDVEPAQLAVTLVNRYHAVKRAGSL